MIHNAQHIDLILRRRYNQTLKPRVFIPDPHYRFLRNQGLNLSRRFNRINYLELCVKDLLVIHLPQKELIAHLDYPRAKPWKTTQMPSQLVPETL